MCRGDTSNGTIVSSPQKGGFGQSKQGMSSACDYLRPPATAYDGQPNRAPPKLKKILKGQTMQPRTLFFELLELDGGRVVPEKCCAACVRVWMLVCAL